MAMTPEELERLGMRREGNAFTQTRGAIPVNGAGVASPQIPVGQATQIPVSTSRAMVPMTPEIPARGSIPVGQVTEQFGARPVTGQAFPGESPKGFAQTPENVRTNVPFTPDKHKMPVQSALANETRLAQAARIGGRVAGTGAAMVLPALAGAGLNAAADKYLAPDQGSAPGPGPASSPSVAQIPGQGPGVVAPPPQKPSWLRDTEVGRNVGNIVNATAGGLPMAMLRAGSGAAAVVDTATAAARGATAASMARPNAGVPTVPPPMQPTAGTQTDVQRGGAGAPAPASALGTPPEAKQSIRDPNFNVVGDQAGRDYTNMMAAKYDNAGTPGGLDASGGSWRGHTWADDKEKRELKMAMDEGRRGGESARTHGLRIAQAGQAYNEFLKHTRSEPQTERAFNSNENVAMARENTLRRVNDQNVAAQRYGAELGLAGHRMSNDVAVAAARRDQDNKDRQYKFDVAKYGTEVAEKNRTAGEQAQAAGQKHLENTFRTVDDKGNNVPDHAKIGSYNAAVTSTLPSFIAALAKAGTPEAMAKMQELQQRGPAALGPEDHAQLSQLFQTREQLRAARSRAPGGAEFKDSDNLMEYRQKRGGAGVEQNMVTPNRVNFEGGSSATMNDLEIQGGANALLPDWGKVRNDNLTRGIRSPN